MVDSSETPQRSIRVDTELWNAAKKKAGMMSLSAIIRALLLAWVNDEIQVDVTGRATVADYHRLAEKLGFKWVGSVQEKDDDSA